jgi:hypothetical protein
MEQNFSLSNPSIQKYLNGDDSYAPVRELIYLHTHPLVSPNFVAQINEIIFSYADRLTSSNTEEVATLQKLCVELGSYLPDITDTNAKAILIALRKLYLICKPNEVYRSETT